MSERREPLEGPVSVAIVEDDGFLRASLAQQVSAIEEFEVCAEAGTLAEGARKVAEKHPDVLIVDLGLPDGDGLDLIARCHNDLPDCQIMVLTVFGDEQKVIGAIERGAQGYLLKDETAIGLAEALHELVRGGSPMSPAIARHLIRRMQVQDDAPEPGNAPAAHGLTPRETEVLQITAKGYTHAEVADLLGITVNTVASYTRKIYEKLAVSSRAEALFEATRLGLLPPA
ncbi:MAG: response regulator transcription factor [Pseudomonadota bacterium]